MFYIDSKMQIVKFIEKSVQYISLIEYATSSLFYKHVYVPVVSPNDWAAHETGLIDNFLL